MASAPIRRPRHLAAAQAEIKDTWTARIFDPPVPIRAWYGNFIERKETLADAWLLLDLGPELPLIIEIDATDDPDFDCAQATRQADGTYLVTSRECCMS